MDAYVLKALTAVLLLGSALAQTSQPIDKVVPTFDKIQVQRLLISRRGPNMNASAYRDAVFYSEHFSSYLHLCLQSSLTNGPGVGVTPSSPVHQPPHDNRYTFSVPACLT